MTYDIRRLAVAVTLFVSCSIGTSAASAAPVPLSFSGGGPVALTVTLTQPVVYIVETAPFATSLGFIFKDVGDASSGVLWGGTGTMSFSINGSAPLPIDRLLGGHASPPDIDLDDLRLARAGGPQLTIGDVVVLNPGTFTTNMGTNVPGPVSGSFETFLTDGSGMRISVPEPASLSLLALGGLALLRRKR